MKEDNNTILPDDPISVNPEFIEESRRSQLCRTRQKSGGPYSKGARRKRRQEVFKLHFELGMPAIKIAEMMGINRNTINDDIEWLYSKMAVDLEGQNFHGYFNKQLVRLETQRARIMGYLNESTDMEQKLAIEKQLTDMDFRLAAMHERYLHGEFKFWDRVSEGVNTIAEVENLDHRYKNIYEMHKIPKRARKLIDAVIEETENKPSIGAGEPIV